MEQLKEAGALVSMVAITVTFFAGYVSGIAYSLDRSDHVFAIIQFMIPPVGVIHGIFTWF